MKLLLIDGYSLLYRAFFSSPPLSTADGRPTGALYGFLRMISRLLDERSPDCAVVALDAHAPTFRHDSFAAYKANRQATPEDLTLQSLLLRPVLDGLSIAHYEHPGYEADDIIGTLARTAAVQGMEVTIVTGDGDALQLVGDNTTVLLTRRGVSELDIYTPAEVVARYGFAPALVPDYKGLRGDSSDNIPGVPGIGEKTGCSLLSRFAGLEELYARIDEVTPPRIRELLLQHREEAFHSRQLARIVTDLDVDIALENCRYRHPLSGHERERARATVREFEFKSLSARYAAEVGESDDGQGDEQEQSQPCALVVTDEAARALAWLSEPGRAGGTIGVVLQGQSGLALAHGADALYYSGEAAALGDWLGDAMRPKAVHDAKTLKLALARAGLELRGVAADTLLMGYLLQPGRQEYTLEQLAAKYLKRKVPGAVKSPGQPAARARAGAAAPPQSLFEVEAAGAEAASEALSAEAASQEAARLGAALQESRLGVGRQACAVAALAVVFASELDSIGERELFETLELPLVDVLVGIERSGMLLDVPQLRRLGAKLETEAALLQSEIWELAGEKFNISSTKQLQTLLYEKLGLARGRAIKTGHSTDVHTLEKLAEEHLVVRKILEYRATTKLKATYVDALLAGLNPETARIHTSLNQTGAVSGRLSSSNPNLQNIPIRTEQGRQIRKAFIVPAGHVMVAADYSQIELRILAHITGDRPLMDAFNAGEDVHARTAADLFGVSVEQVDGEMRRKAKMTNYAIAYGVSGFGLAKQLGTGTAGEAQEFIKRYFETLPGVKAYMDSTLEEARAKGYVQTLMGRRRPLPEINSPRHVERAAAERTAINHPIQGTAADMMKLAMLAIDRQLRESGLASRMLLQVHDELVFEVVRCEMEAVTELAERLMREVPTERLKLKVPLEVDIGSGSNWDQTKGGLMTEDSVDVEEPAD